MCDFVLRAASISERPFHIDSVGICRHIALNIEAGFMMRREFDSTVTCVYFTLSSYYNELLTRVGILMCWRTLDVDGDHMQIMALSPHSG